MSVEAITKTADALLTERVCRVTLDLKIRIAGISLEKLQQSIYWDEADQARSLALADRQNRLLHSLLRDEVALNQFLAYVALGDLKFRLDADPSVAVPVKDEDEILKSVLRELGEEGVGLVEEAATVGSLLDDTELFHSCFTVDWDNSVLSDIEAMR
ncbi:MAG: hypothetical protein QOH51_178 [Acidobacteriota bacterium]|jgi:hypothetical protein|nr:hypothetical protein [Acidobacteriota bacterium]